MADETSSAINWHEWLRSERRLGVSHWDVGDTLRSAPAVAPPTAGPSARPPREPAPPAPVAQRPAALPVPRMPSARPGASSPGGAAQATDLPPLNQADPSPEAAQQYLQQLNEGYVKTCRRCALCDQGRRQTVFGVGNLRPELVFVGEGPGEDEDLQGEPFVGRAGQLLTRMIAAMQLTRDQVYIANVVKCRPPNNRTPTEDEMTACSPFLFRQLSVLRPKVIVALGRPASQTLLATTESIGKLRGRFHDFPSPAHQHLGIPACKIMPTYHPAYLLRSPGEKGKVWADLQQVMAFLGIPLPGKAAGE